MNSLSKNRKLVNLEGFYRVQNCKDQRTRLREAERILEKYLNGIKTIQIVDDAGFVFKILIMAILNWFV